MSQQAFFDPEQDYDATQPVESGYQVHQRELTGEHPAWEKHDEASRRHLVGEKLRPQRSRLSPLHILIVLLVLIIVISFGSFVLKVDKFISALQSAPVQVYDGHKQSDTVTNTAVQLFPVTTGPVKLTLNDAAAGSIRIHTGDTDQIAVSETLQTTHHDSTLDTQPLEAVQTGNTLNMTVSSNQENDNAAGIILDIYTPSNVTLDINAPSASLISITGVDGQINASTQEGSIIATDDNMTGSSSLKSEGGGISFTGSFDRKGTYEFSSQTGNITMGVSADSSFRLNTAGTNPDKIINDFGTDVIGNHPAATVIVHAEKGSVTLGNQSY